MTQAHYTRKQFVQQHASIFAALKVHDWKNARVQAQAYKEAMGAAFASGYHVVANQALDLLNSLQEFTITQEYKQSSGYNGLAKNRLFKTFVVDFLNVDPELAASYLLLDSSGSDSRLVQQLIRNSAFIQWNDEERESNDREYSRLEGIYTLIGNLLKNNKAVLASKMIEAMLTHEDLKGSLFQINEAFITAITSGPESLFFTQFLEKMEPRLFEIAEWASEPGQVHIINLRSRPLIRKLAERGMPAVALKIYIGCNGEFSGPNELTDAERVFGKKFIDAELVWLSNHTTIKTFKAYVEYFMQDPANRWFFLNGTTQKQNSGHSGLKSITSLSTYSIVSDRKKVGAMCREQAKAILEIMEKHKHRPDFEAKRDAFMALYAVSLGVKSETAYNELKDYLPAEYLDPIEAFRTNRLEQDLGI
jgi:hypothetical protein